MSWLFRSLLLLYDRHLAKLYLPGLPLAVWTQICSIFWFLFIQAKFPLESIKYKHEHIYDRFNFTHFHNLYYIQLFVYFFIGIYIKKVKNYKCNCQVWTSMNTVTIGSIWWFTLSIINLFFFIQLYIYNVTIINVAVRYRMI